MDQLIAKFLSEGGKIEKLPSGYAIGYIPQTSAITRDVDDMADDIMGVMICSLNPFGNDFMKMREDAKQGSINLKKQRKYTNRWWNKTK